MGRMQRIAITGSSGYYGRRMIREFRHREPQAVIAGIDLAPAEADEPDEFFRCDVQDAALADTLERFAPDTVLHFAFAVQPTRNRAAQQTVNVKGTENVLAVVARCRPQRFLLASSATAYGAWPDQPVPLDESHPIRPRPEFGYAADKGVIEQRIAEFVEEHPEMAVSWTRPTILCGPGAQNYLSRIFLTVPFMILPDGQDTPQQFVHEDDAAAATWSILAHDAQGAFNVAPDDWLTQSEIGREMRIRSVRLPFWLVRVFAACWWRLRLPLVQVPPGLVYYLRYPWVIRPARLQDELGFTFQHGSRAALRSMLEVYDPQVASET